MNYKNFALSLLKTLIISFLFFFTISNQASARPIYGIFVGKVTDTISGNPIENASIQTDAGSSANSLSDGTYSIVHPPGTWKITVGAANYETATLENIFIGEAETREINFVLTPLPGCALDLDYTTRDYHGNKTKDIESAIMAEANSEIWVAVVAQSVINLDTYQVDVNFNPDRMTFIEGIEDNAFEGISNFLKANGGTTVGFMAVEKSPGVVNIANSVVGNNPEEAPDGSGIIALLKFKILDSAPNNHLTLSNVDYLDSQGSQSSGINVIDAYINHSYLENVIIVLQIMTSIDSYIQMPADINGDSRIDMAEAIFYLQKAAALR